MHLFIYLIALFVAVRAEQQLQPNTSLKLFPYILNVTRSPVIVFLDTHIHLSCEIEGNPIPKIKWYRYDVLLNETRRIKFHNNSRMIEIAPADFEDSGSYECIGSNKYGNVSAFFSVEVKGAPVIVDVQTSPFIVEEGNHFDIFCYVNGNPYPSVSWTRNSNRVVLNSRMSYTDKYQVLNFSPGRVSDSGFYRCSFNNSYGTDKNEIEVIVGKTPKIGWVSLDRQIIALGDTVMLYCGADGSPAPNITWKSNANISRNRVEFLYDKAVMLINDVMDSDAGSYTCQARNVIGEDKKVIDLHVVDGNDVLWLAWSIWQCTACSGTCAEGGGATNCRRRRSCIGTVSSPNVCSGVQEELKRESCHLTNCPGQWTQWSVWNCEGCSKSCGGGIETCHRNRTCLVHPCQGNGWESETINCNIHTCLGLNTPDIYSTTPLYTEAGRESESSVGLYIGVAAGVIFVLIVIIVFIVVVMRRRSPAPDRKPVTSNKSTNSVNLNQHPNHAFNKGTTRRASGVYDQLHEPGMDENVYSTIDDYGKYTEIKDLPEDGRPKYLELIDGKAVYSENGFANGGYQISGSEQTNDGHDLNNKPSTDQPAPNNDSHAYFVLEKQT